MSKYFKPYEGDRPFVFISYSHQNSETVLETITKLKDKRLRLWYDEGIPAGSDWPSNIERHMHDCEAVVFFVSGPSLISPNCLSEIRTALKKENPKPVFFVKLEDVIIPKEEDVKNGRSIYRISKNFRCLIKICRLRAFCPGRSLIDRSTENGPISSKKSGSVLSWQSCS